MIQRITFASDLHKAGVNEEELLSKLYCHFLSNTEEVQGNWIAHHVLDQIQQFDEMQKCLPNRQPDKETLANLGENIINMMDGFVVTSQCRKLHSLNQAMTVLDKLFQGSCTPEEAAQMTPAGYKGNVGEKGRNDALHKVLDNLFAPMEKTKIQQQAECAVRNLRQDWMDDTLYRAILIISLYTMMVNGAWASDILDLPISIEYIAVAVCCMISGNDSDVAVKMFLLKCFLAAGTATVMFIGSAIAIYAAYFLTTQKAGELILAAEKT